MNQELIPGLPEDIARQCLIRVPFDRFGSTGSVCRLWKQEIGSPLFHRIRKLSNLTRPIIVLVQAEPALSQSGPAHKYHSASTPSYKLTVFEPSTATWRTLPPIPGLTNGLPLFCQVAVVEREIVVVGGWDTETWAPSNRVYIHELATGAWRRGARMPGPNRSFFACAGSSGVVFIAGGHDEEKTALRSALAYDVAGDKWVSLPDMEKERDECKGLFLRGMFHVIGGYPTDYQGQFSKSSEVFNVDTWRWGPVEEDKLDCAVCPRTCVAGGKERMYMCQQGHVAVLEGTTWRDVIEVPERASMASVLIAWQEKMMLFGLDSHGGALEGYKLDVGDGRKVTWQKVEVPTEFSGHVQTSCCLEI